MIPALDLEAGTITLGDRLLTVVDAMDLADRLYDAANQLEIRARLAEIEAGRTPESRALERDQFLADVITTALEGGVGYWAKARTYHWFSPDLDGGTAEPTERGGANACAVLVDRENALTNADGSAIEHKVDPGVIVKAFETLAGGPVNHVSSRTSARLLGALQDLEGGDIDSSDADMLVQIGLFGEVVYG